MNKTATLVSLLFAASALACSGAAAPRAAASGPPPASSGETPASQTPALPPGHPPVGSGAAAAPGGPDQARARVSGTVKLSPTLAAGPADVLYVIAKQGTTTVAVQRIEKPAFPLAFTLSAADAMMSGVAFEGPVDLTARLSKTGDAIPSTGDLEGVTKGVKVPAAGVQVTIDTTRP